MTSPGRNGTSLMHKAEGAGNPAARCRRPRVSRFGGVDERSQLN